jgi:chloramphenicol-sensitive protein RarD
VESLAAETAVQFLPALGYLLFLSTRGSSAFASHGAGHALLLACCGFVTAAPPIQIGRGILVRAR